MAPAPNRSVQQTALRSPPASPKWVMTAFVGPATLQKEKKHHARTEDTMTRVEPFHSKKFPGVYHVCTNCTEGNNIERENRVPGTGGGKMCERCKELTNQGKC